MPRKAPKAAKPEYIPQHLRGRALTDEQVALRNASLAEALTGTECIHAPYPESLQAYRVAMGKPRLKDPNPKTSRRTPH